MQLQRNSGVVSPRHALFSQREYHASCRNLSCEKEPGQNHLLFYFISRITSCCFSSQSCLKHYCTLLVLKLGVHVQTFTSSYTIYCVCLSDCCCCCWNILWLGRSLSKLWAVGLKLYMFCFWGFFRPQNKSPHRCCEGSSLSSPFPCTDIRPVCPVTLLLRTLEVPVPLLLRRRMDNPVMTPNMQHCSECY